MKFLDKAEDLARRLPPEDAEVIQKLISEVRLGRSQARRLRRNKKSILAKTERDAVSTGDKTAGGQ